MTDLDLEIIAELEPEQWPDWVFQDPGIYRELCEIVGEDRADELFDQFLVHYVHEEQQARIGGHVKCLPGRFAVAMDIPRQSYGELSLPERAQMTGRSDVGTVVASGVGLPVGKRVVVQFGGGKRILDWECNGYECADLRFYGIVGGTLIDRPSQGDSNDAEEADWRDLVLAEYENGELTATGDRVILELPEMEESEGGILISLRSRKLPPTAIVHSAGPESGVKDGDEAIYHQGAATRGGTGRFIKWKEKTYLSLRKADIYGTV